MNKEHFKILMNYRYPFLKKLFYPGIKAREFLLNRIKNYKEEVYENLCNMIINEPIIRVEEFQGIFSLDLRSDLFKRILIKKHYEPKLARCCLKYLNKKRDAIDVGANIGFYSVLFARNLDGKKSISRRAISACITSTL